jgi:hypothetical protein
MPPNEFGFAYEKSFGCSALPLKQESPSNLDSVLGATKQRFPDKLAGTTRRKSGKISLSEKHYSVIFLRVRDLSTESVLLPRPSLLL